MAGVAHVVVAALSARPLAQSARRAGWGVVALDLFGDVDTRAASLRWAAIGDAEAMRVDGARLLSALNDARREGDCLGWIAGAGFEAQPELLEAGARVLPLVGNDHAVTSAVRGARRFFAALDEAGIAHPETRFEAPSQPQGWLVKDFASSGGWHVQRTSSLPREAGEGWGGGRKHASAQTTHPASRPLPHPPPQAGEGVEDSAASDDSHAGELASAGHSGTHYQREHPGRPMSLLFLADGRKVAPIAINALRVRAHGSRPFVYHGAIGPISDARPAVASTLVRAAYALVQAFGLRGLMSLDVLVDGDDVFVLELNARPTATLALHDDQAAHGLLHAHVDACRGKLPQDAQAFAPTSRPRPLRGESVVFARRRCTITDDHARRLAALGCRDIPQPGSTVPAAAPLCTVAAQGTSTAQVESLLAARESAVLALVQNRNEVLQHIRQHAE